MLLSVRLLSTVLCLKILESWRSFRSGWQHFFQKTKRLYGSCIRWMIFQRLGRKVCCCQTVLRPLLESVQEWNHRVQSTISEELSDREMVSERLGDTVLVEKSSFRGFHVDVAEEGLFFLLSLLE